MQRQPQPQQPQGSAAEGAIGKAHVACTFGAVWEAAEPSMHLLLCCECTEDSGWWVFQSIGPPTGALRCYQSWSHRGLCWLKQATQASPQSDISYTLRMPTSRWPPLPRLPNPSHEAALICHPTTLHVRCEPNSAVGVSRGRHHENTCMFLFRGGGGGVELQYAEFVSLGAIPLARLICGTDTSACFCRRVMSR